MYYKPQWDGNCDRDNLMELSDYLKTFRERWLLILVCTLVGGGLAGLITQRIQPTYTGEATLFLKVDSKAGSLYERSQFGLQRVKSYPAVVQSPDVLLPVMAELKLGGSLEDLKARVSATNPTNTFFLKVQAEDSSAEQAAALANSVAKNLALQVAVLETAKGEAASAVSLVETVPASPPSSRTSPSLPLNGALGLLTGLSAGLATAVIGKRFGQRIRTADDVRAASDLPVLGVLNRKPRHTVLTASRRKSAHDDTRSRQDLVTNLQLVAGGRLPNFLVLVSDLDWQAKLTLRQELASTLANTGRAVCVLDSEISAGSPEVRALPAAPRGLADLLSEKCEVVEALAPSTDGQFQILPAGAKAVAPSEFVTEKRFPMVANRLRESFDVILAEASPRSETLSLAIVAPCADGVLLAVEYAKTRKRELARLLAEVKAFGLRPLGVVMTSVPGSRSVPVTDGWRSGDFRETDLQFELQRVHEYR